MSCFETQGTTLHMSTNTRTQVPQEHTIIDTDVHLAIPPTDLQSYTESPYSKRLEPTPISTPLPRDGWDRSLFGKIPILEDLESVSTAERLNQALCKQFNIDYPIINTFALITRLPESDYAVALMRAYNDYLLDNFLDEYDHFRGLITITTQKPDQAAEEIDRLADEDQIVGIYIHSTGPNPPLGDPTYDIIYQSAQDHGLPVAYHGSVNGFMYEFPRQNQSLERFLATHVLAHSWSQMLTLTSLLVNGTPEKFPDLNFAFLEAGIGWVPYMMYRLNKECSIRRSEVPLLEKSPEEYIRDQFVFGTQPIGEPNRASDMQKVIELVGVDSIVFSTDYPHWDFDQPDGFDKFIKNTFDEEARERVLSTNAADIFGIDI